MKSNKDKIEFLNANTHHLLVHYDADGETCSEVLVRLTPNVEDTLIHLGLDETWIDANKMEWKEGGYVIDLTHVGFDRCGAVWWTGQHGFMEHKSE